MIKIEFEQKSKKEILIFGIDTKGKKKEIGHIITPAGSGETSINAIQICGFDHAYDFWGCGVYGDKVTGKMKKDIQLIWFNNYNKMTCDEIRKIKVSEKIMKDRFSIGEEDGVCHKCFNYPCTCEINIEYENPYMVKTEQDVKPYSEVDYKLQVKTAILDGLKNDNR